VLPLVTLVASAQTKEDAHALLQEIASSAHAAKNWRAEGAEVGDFTGQGIEVHGETRFKIAVEGPSHYRRESSDADRNSADLDLAVCDGTNRWTHSANNAGFGMNAIGGSACEPEHVYIFDKLADNLLTATVIGHDRLQFEGGLRDCDIVHAEYDLPVGLVRDICIDRIHRLVLRDRTEMTDNGVKSTTTITYRAFEFNAKLPADTFEFHVPTGSFEDRGPYLETHDPVPENGVYPIGGNVLPPNLIDKAEPSYPESAREAGISGMVLVSLAVDEAGNPQNLRVTRGLGHGLDENELR
jgi:outer membrane lipoprotein-sorting protein